MLDAIWTYFGGELFTVWLRVWVAATEDADLYQRLAPLQRELSRAIADAIADLRPPDITTRDWKRRIGIALDTMRGLALRRAIEPQEATSRDAWPGTRSELTQLLDRKADPIR